MPPAPTVGNEQHSKDTGYIDRFATTMAAQAFPFRVVEHLVPCQYIRDYPRATSVSQEDTLQLAVKQYIPLDNLNPQPGDVTIIGAHANAFPKEMYEPLWEDLLSRSKKNGFRIRSIWIADVAHQGASGILNENLLGNDPSWLDHPRDLLHLINLKRAEMPRPIIGIGHSMGGGHLVGLANLHPRLFTSIVLLDPAINSFEAYTKKQAFKFNKSNAPIATLASTYRRELWPSRAEAEKMLGKAKFYQTWDPRVFSLWIKYGLRELPTALHPLDSQTESLPPGQRPVTLSTTLHQEVFTFSRAAYNVLDPNSPITEYCHPDLDPDFPVGQASFYRSEPPRIYEMLRTLRPSALYIFGETSEMSSEEFTQMKLEVTGSGVGGSGGVRKGRVAQHTLKGIGHLVPMEAVGDTAELSAEWIGNEMKRWRKDEAEFKKLWDQRTQVEKMTVDAEWKKRLGPPPMRRNGNNGKPGKPESKL